MQIAILIELFLILISLITIVYILNTIFNRKNTTPAKEPVDTELAKMLLEENFVSKVNLLIDSIIKEHAEVYQVMILSVNEETAQYITTEKQNEMQNYVIEMTMRNISPETRSIIGLVYNIDEEKDLRHVITLRTKLYLINFIVEYNKEFSE